MKSDNRQGRHRVLNTVYSLSHFSEPFFPVHASVRNNNTLLSIITLWETKMQQPLYSFAPCKQLPEGCPLYYLWLKALNSEARGREYPKKAIKVYFSKGTRHMKLLIVVLCAFVCAFEAAKYKYFVQNAGDFVDGIWVVCLPSPLGTSQSILLFWMTDDFLVVKKPLPLPPSLLPLTSSLASRQKLWLVREWREAIEGPPQLHSDR